MMNTLQFFKATGWLFGALLTSAACGGFGSFAAIEIYAHLHPEIKYFSSQLGASWLAIYCFPFGFAVGLFLFWLMSKTMKRHLQK